MAKKFDAQFPFKLTAESKAALLRIAAARPIDAQEILRSAVYAIIEYATVNGDEAVPLDMAITPRNAPSASSLAVAEELYKLVKAEEKKKNESRKKA